MNNLGIRYNITAKFTASEWQLFTASMDCQDAANKLNAALEHAVNSGWSRYEVEDYMDRVMVKLREFGAADSEPSYFLYEVLDRIYGESTE